MKIAQIIGYHLYFWKGGGGRIPVKTTGTGLSIYLSNNTEETENVPSPQLCSVTYDPKISLGSVMLKLEGSGP